MIISLVQFNISPKDKKYNLAKIQELLAGKSRDLVVLPEMFNTGFCTDDMSISESMDGETVSWLKKTSKESETAICGSFLCSEEGTYFNRFVMVSDGEVVGHYDKTHLFGLGGEQEHITAGNSKVDMVIQGFKIRPIICYDLRFAYASFNDTEYDVLINVANWPSQRIAHWDVLLQARSIENQVYVVGCNRVGEQDGYFYPGHSAVYAPDGERRIHSVKEEVLSVSIDKKYIEQTRKKLPFLKDRRM